MKTNYSGILRLAAAAILLTGTVISSLPVPVVYADTPLVVTTTDDNINDPCPGANCSLRSAIALANSDPNTPYTITFSGAGVGTIFLSAVGPGETENHTGDLNITTHSLLTINGANIVTIDGRPSQSGAATDRIFNIAAGSSVYLQRLTITNGLTTNVGTYCPDDPQHHCVDDGGAILNQGTLTLDNMTLSNNKAGDGKDDASGITAPINGGRGGAIFNTGNLSIKSNSTLSTNTTGNGFGSSGKGGDGGAIYNYDNATLSIVNSTLSNNATGSGAGAGDDGYGGAMFNDGTVSQLSGVFFTSNQTGTGYTDSVKHDGGNGGAIFNNGGAVISNIFGSTFTTNHTTNGMFGGSGGDGGAIFNPGSILLITQKLGNPTKFSGNYTGNGGDGTPANGSGSGGNGGAIYNGGNIDTFTYIEFSSNHTGGGGMGTSTATGSGGNGGDGGAIWTGTLTTIGLNGTIANLAFDQNYTGDGGKSDLTHADASGGTGGNGGAIYNGVGGAFSATITATTFTSNHTGHGGDTNNGRGGAGGAGGAIDNANTGHMLGLLTTTFSGNFTGIGGNGSQSTGPGGNGGAIANLGSIGTIKNAIIGPTGVLSGNTTGTGGIGSSNSHGSGGMGAGIYTKGSITQLNASTILGNSTGGNIALPGGSGGGIAMDGTTAEMDILNSTIAQNKASAGGNGAGIYFYDAKTLTISQSTIFANQNLQVSGIPSGHGAGITKDFSSNLTPYVSVKGSILSNNTRETASVASDCYDKHSLSYKLHSGDGMGGYNVVFDASLTDPDFSCSDFFDPANHDIHTDPQVQTLSVQPVVGNATFTLPIFPIAVLNNPAVDLIPRKNCVNFPNTSSMVDELGAMRHSLCDAGALEVSDPSVIDNDGTFIYLPKILR